MTRITSVCTALVAIGAMAASASAQQVALTMPVFPFPGLGAFLPPVIEARGFDAANGLDITWRTEPERVYRTNFAAGTNRIGGSATLLADVAKLNELGVETVFLFNLFDYWGTVVVAADSAIRTLADLEGRTLAAALPTTNYAMFRYAAKMDGVDIARTEIQASPVPGLMPILLAGRVDAVQVWEPAHSQLVHGTRGWRALDVVGVIARHTGQSKLPYVGVAAHRAWVEANRDLVPKLFATYSMAAAFIENDPETAAGIISEASEGRLTRAVLAELIRSGRMGMDVYWVAEALPAARAAFEAAMEIEYLNRMPADTVIYAEP